MLQEGRVYYLIFHHFNGESLPIGPIDDIADGYLGGIPNFLVSVMTIKSLLTFTNISHV